MKHRLLFLMLALSGAAQAGPVPLAQGRGIAWTFTEPHGEAHLRLADERGEIFDFALGRALQWSFEGLGLPDGAYRYELTIAPPHAAHRGADAQEIGEAPQGAMQSGAFYVQNGRILEGGAEAAAAKAKAPNAKDLVIADDRIVIGNLCTGLDCVNDEGFGDDVLRLKENNTRLTFDDTSPAGFPATDWELTANDSPSGGASSFTLLQRTLSRTPLRLLGGAPSGSVHLAANGNVGVHTAAPQQRLHLVTNDQPTLRLDQSNSGGFLPSTWDLQTNESRFSVRDAMTGRAPFTIRAEAPGGAVTIDASSRVGFGTPTPAAALHVVRSNGQAGVIVEEASVTAATRTLLELRNAGGPGIALTGAAGGWKLAAGGPLSFASTLPAAGTLQLADSGNLVISGTLSQGSSRTLKHAIEAVSPSALLQRVSALPVFSWQYLADAGGRHLGPMAEDVHAAFGLGIGERSLAPGDVAGLAMAATQALREELAARDAELDALLQRLDALEAQAAGAP